MTAYFGPVEVRHFGQGAGEEVLSYPHASVRLVDGVASYLHGDQLGSVRTVTDAAGGVAKRSTYRPFGEVSDWGVDPATAAETKGFIGERFDADAGLQYLNARYYDPQLALFLQPDWFEVTKAGVGTNRYAYSLNDPVNLRDPGGNCFEDACVIEGIALGLLTIFTADAAQDIQNGPQVGDSALGNPIGRAIENIFGVFGGNSVKNEKASEDASNLTDKQRETDATGGKSATGGPDKEPEDKDLAASAKNAKRISSNARADKIARKFGYRNAHALKNEYGLDAKSDLFFDSKSGRLFAGPRQGFGSRELLDTLD